MKTIRMLRNIGCGVGETPKFLEGQTYTVGPDDFARFVTAQLAEELPEVAAVQAAASQSEIPTPAAKTRKGEVSGPHK